MHGFGAGGLKDVTINARVNGIKKLLNELQLAPFDLLDCSTIVNVSRIC